MKEIKTYEDLIEFTHIIMKNVYPIPSNLIFEVKLNPEDYNNLLSGIPLQQAISYGMLNKDSSFKLKYADITFKIILK